MNDHADCVYAPLVAKIAGASLSMSKPSAKPARLASVDAGFGGVMNVNAIAAGSSVIEFDCFHAAQPLPATPGSYGKLA